MFFSVGTIEGSISLWEVSSREKLVSRNFQVWNIGASSMILKVRSFSINITKASQQFISAKKYEF